MNPETKSEPMKRFANIYLWPRISFADACHPSADDTYHTDVVPRQPEVYWIDLDSAPGQS
jgi:hypothetical protein